jgi:hypothetical protein
VQHSALFDGPQETFDDKAFSRPLVTRLVQQLEDRPLPFMTPNEHDQLLVLLETSVEVNFGPIPLSLSAYPTSRLKNKYERLTQMASATLSPCAPFTFSTNVSQVRGADHPTPTSFRILLPQSFIQHSNTDVVSGIGSGIEISCGLFTATARRFFWQQVPLHVAEKSFGRMLERWASSCG